MATTHEFIEYVCKQINASFDIRYKKMFGEYMVYINDKPIILVCDNTVYIKQVEELKELLKDVDKGYPFDNAKECFVIDIDDRELFNEVIGILEPITPLPKPRKKKIKSNEKL